MLRHSEFAVNYKYVKLSTLTASYRWFYYGAMSNTLVFTAFYFALFLSVTIIRHLNTHGSASETVHRERSLFL